MSAPGHIPEGHPVRKLYLEQYSRLEFPPSDTLSVPDGLGRRFPFNFKKVPSQVRGRCFFPGGSGLWKEHQDANWAWQPFPKDPIFVIGQDLDSEDNFTNSTCVIGYEYGMGTWAGVKQMQDKVGLPLGQCFFTNFLPGLRLSETNQGMSPAWKFPDFAEKCFEFLNLQILLLRPRAVFLLGKFCAQQVIKRWGISINSSNDCIHSSWETNENHIFGLNEIDGSGKAVGTFATRDGRNIKYGVLTHPANRGANIGRRTYKKYSGNRTYEELTGDNAERQIIDEVLAEPAQK